jgi:uncharacterized protein (TIGR00725 family)
MSQRKYPYIAVIGGGTCSIETAALAEKVGAAIAQAKAVLICGGLGGVMEAAARGARRAGGTTIGILPGSDYRTANEFVDHAICTGLGEARNVSIVMTADGLIALPGEFGTLSEISFALKYNKPVVSLGSWAVSDRIIIEDAPEKAVRRILKEIG